MYLYGELRVTLLCGTPRASKMEWGRGRKVFGRVSFRFVLFRARLYAIGVLFVYVYVYMFTAWPHPSKNLSLYTASPTRCPLLPPHLATFQ